MADIEAGSAKAKRMQTKDNNVEKVKQPFTRSKPSVLFLCDGQHGHSLVAQSILTHKAETYFDSFSAHTAENANLQAACQVLSQYNIACSDKHFHPVSHYQGMELDYLVALSPSSVQSGKKLPQYQKFIPWDVTQGGESTNTRQVIKYINDQINYFLSVYLYR